MGLSKKESPSTQKTTLDGPDVALVPADTMSGSDSKQYNKEVEKIIPPKSRNASFFRFPWRKDNFVVTSDSKPEQHLKENNGADANKGAIQNELQPFSSSVEASIGKEDACTRELPLSLDYGGIDCIGMSELSISESHGPHSLLSKGYSLNVEHSTGLSTDIALMHRDGVHSRRRNILKLARISRNLQKRSLWLSGVKCFV
jgi:hypothetical protein